MKAVIVGVPGTGKTSVAKGLTKHGWTLVTFGTVMFEIAKEKHGISTRDKMRTELSTDTYKLVQEEAASQISSMEGKIVLDTHCSIITPEGYYPGLPLRILEKLNPDAIISVEADPENINARRQKDAAIRLREGDPKEHQEVNRYFAAAYSTVSGAPISFVMNEEGKLDETVLKVLKIVKGVQRNG